MIQNFLLTMSRHNDFVGKRADKFTVTGLVGEVEYENADGISTKGVAKEVDYYTITCDEPDCDGVGYHDKRGEIICDVCGRVLSGDSKPVLRTEYNADNDGDGVGSSRGLEKEKHATRGSHEPAI